MYQNLQNHPKVTNMTQETCGMTLCRYINAFVRFQNITICKIDAPTHIPCFVTHFSTEILKKK